MKLSRCDLTSGGLALSAAMPLRPAGAVAAAHQAVQSFGVPGQGFSDYLNKPDVGTTIARQWFDREGVDMLANSGVALDDGGCPLNKV
jgi:branched-chain amino acid transport system substrate-binding protein